MKVKPSESREKHIAKFTTHKWDSENSSLPNCYKHLKGTLDSTYYSITQGV